MKKKSSFRNQCYRNDALSKDVSNDKFFSLSSVKIILENESLFVHTSYVKKKPQKSNGKYIQEKNKLRVVICFLVKT